MNARIARLRDIRRLETGAEMEEYDKLISEIASDEPLDPALLPDLFMSFFDATEGDQVMWGLLHLVEDFPAEAYASALVGTLPQMVNHAREWATRLLMRMLNSEKDRPLLRAAYLGATPLQQQLVRELLAEIVGDNKTFAPKTAQVVS
jgi:hypothetical protein